MDRRQVQVDSDLKWSQKQIWTDHKHYDGDGKPTKSDYRRWKEWSRWPYALSPSFLGNKTTSRGVLAAECVGMGTVGR